MNLQKVVHFAIGPIAAAALGLITLPFVAWFFSVEDVGRLTMMQVVLSLSVSLFSLAMHQAYVREYHEEDDKNALLKLSMLPGLIFLTVTTLVIVLLPYSLSVLLFGIESQLLTFLLILGVYASFVINFLSHILRMEERGLAFSATKIAPKIFFILFIGLIMLLDLNSDFNTLMLMNTLAVIFSLIIFLWITKETCIAAIRKKIDIALMKKMLLFSLPLVAGGLAYWGLTTMDRFFLRSMSGFEELGVYALAASLAGAVSVISTVFSNLWHPTLYKWVQQGVKPDKIQAVIENMMLAVAVIWSFVGLFSFILPLLLPKEYESIEFLIVACVSMPLFYMLAQTTGVGIGITRKSLYSMLASIVAFIANAILNYFLIPKHGAAGAALATVISFFIFFIVRTEASSKLWYSLPRKKVYLILLVYTLVTTCELLVKNKVPFFSFIWIGTLFFVYLLFYQRVYTNFQLIKKYIKGRS